VCARNVVRKVNGYLGARFIVFLWKPALDQFWLKVAVSMYVIMSV